MDSYDRSLKQLSDLNERITLQFKSYSPAFVDFAMENDLPTIMQEFSRQGSIRELAKKGLEKMDFARGKEISLEEDIPSFFLEPHYNRKGTIGFDEFKKKNKGETFIYQFEISLRRNEKQKIWQTWFEGYSFTGDLEAKDTINISQGLYLPTKEKIEMLGRQLLTPKSVEALVT